MEPVGPATAARIEIISLYKKATYYYAVLFALLVIGFVVPVMGAVWLATLLPASIAGIFFTKRGLALASKHSDQEKKGVGYANLVLGISLLVLGLLVVAFIYQRN